MFHGLIPCSTGLVSSHDAKVMAGDLLECSPPRARQGFASGRLRRLESFDGPALGNDPASGLPRCNEEHFQRIGFRESIGQHAVLYPNCAIPFIRRLLASRGCSFLCFRSHFPDNLFSRASLRSYQGHIKAYSIKSLESSAFQWPADRRSFRMRENFPSTGTQS